MEITATTLRKPDGRRAATRYHNTQTGNPCSKDMGYFISYVYESLGEPFFKMGERAKYDSIMEQTRNLSENRGLARYAMDSIARKMAVRISKGERIILTYKEETID